MKLKVLINEAIQQVPLKTNVLESKKHIPISKYVISIVVILLLVLLLMNIDIIADYLYAKKYTNDTHIGLSSPPIFPRVEIIKLIIYVLGGAVALWGLILNRSKTNALLVQTKNQTYKMEMQVKNLIAERFKDAVSALKEERLALRLRAIYSLHQIAIDKNSKEDYAEMVFNLFCAYLREGGDYDDSKDWDSQTREYKKKFKAPETTQAILDFLFPPEETNTPMWYNKTPNLTGAILIKVNLEERCLNGVKLIGAKLQMANLKKAKLIGAELWSAKLSGTNLYKAHLEGAKLYDANIIRADLTEAFLQGSFFNRAILYGTGLTKANLQGSDFSNARIQGCRCENIQLQGTTGFSFDCRELTELTKNIIDKYKDEANFTSEYIAELEEGYKALVLNPNCSSLTIEDMNNTIIEIKRYCSIDVIINDISNRMSSRVNK